MRIVSSAIVARPAQRLFELSQDYRRRLEWDTYLAKACLLGNAGSAAVGVESYCRNRTGGAMVSRYISYAPPTHAAVRMVSGPRPLARFSGTWRFRPVSSDTTEVHFIYNVGLRPRGMRWLLEPVVAWLYGRSMQRRIMAFKRWAEHAR